MSDVEMTAIDADDDVDISDIKGILSGSEEGEINDTDSDDASSVPQRRKEDNVLNKINGNKYSFQTDGDNGINRSIFDDSDLAQMGERVNRFGLDIDSDVKILEKEKTDLYESLSIVTQEDIRHARLDTIHVHGTDKMKTNDIFEYFFAHKPSFLEWVSENSCNVVWKDDISAARAMVFYSKEIVYESDSAMDEDISMNGKDVSAISKDAVRLADIKVPVPPGRWRAGAPHPLADYIFLRFANKSDKKVSGKEKLKVYSKKYRNSTDSGGVGVQGGLISESMKSKIKSMKERVYEAEDEKSKNPWGELCETWGINDSQEVFGVSDSGPIGHPALLPFYKPSSVKNRIGVMGPSHPHLPVTERLSIPFRRNHGNVKMRLGKRAPEVIDVADSADSEEESQSSDEEWTSRRKVPRMRMHADDEQEKMNKKRTNSDQPTLPWDDEVSLNTITVEVKNEDVDKPSVQPDSRNKRIDTSKHKNAKDLRSRIGTRRKSYESESDDSSSPPSQGVTSRSRQTAASTVWSRLDVSRSTEPANSHSDSDSESQNDLRHAISKSITKIISNRPGFNKVDLRSRLGKKSDFRASPLRIEVDNELYTQSDEE